MVKLNDVLCNALPGYLSSFTVKEQERQIFLHWITVNDISLKQYLVQRSNNGKKYNWIATVKATNSNQYTYTDTLPLNGYNHYRLKVVDKSGKFTYGNIAALHFFSFLHLYKLEKIKVIDYNKSSISVDEVFFGCTS